MKPIAEIFSQGEEITHGHIVDSNAAWLSQQLVALGFRCTRHTAVGDNLDDLIALFSEIAERADCCICTGGLGPTIDDLTAEAVSIAAGLPLQFDEQAFSQIQDYYACRQRLMPEANRKQAMLPETSQRIDNALGTAPGFALQFKRCWFVFLPGVPSEMMAMFQCWVKAQLPQRFSLQADCLVTLRSLGIGESAIQQCLNQVILPEGVQLGFRAAVDEVQTKLLFPAGFPDEAKRSLVKQLAQRIGDYVFAIDGLDGVQGSLLEVIDHAMRHHQQTVAVLETASQGLIAAKCVGRKWLQAVSVSLDQAATARDWHIDLNSQDSAGVAQLLAEKLKRQQGTDFALVQLYAGDWVDYRDQDKAIVLYNVLSTPQGIVSCQHTIAGAELYKQNQAALLALDLLRRYLQHQCH